MPVSADLQISLTHQVTNDVILREKNNCNERTSQLLTTSTKDLTAATYKGRRFILAHGFEDLQFTLGGSHRLEYLVRLGEGMGRSTDEEDETVQMNCS